jgi:flavodoxin
MKRTIVIYYSKNGNNRFLAHKISEALNCDLEEIIPRWNAHLFLLLGPRLGNKRIKSDLAAYDRVILVGPIWMGKLIAPLKSFILKYRKKIKELVFVTCCGSSFEKKDEKFGHGLVFDQIHKISGNCTHCEALPITMVVPENKKEDPQIVLNTRLTEENFKGKIVEIFNDFIKKVSA